MVLSDPLGNNGASKSLRGVRLGGFVIGKGKSMKLKNKLLWEMYHTLIPHHFIPFVSRARLID